MSHKNHYERAFEQFLRERHVPYFANSQEHRNRLVGGQTVKNFDFVLSVDPVNWVVDVKGRRFPGGESHQRYWKHWTTEDDLAGLLHWERFLGNAFRGLFVFAYLIETQWSPLPAEQLFTFRKRHYAFIGMELHDYIAEARLISPRWRTLELPTKRFRQLARPLGDFLS